MGQELMKSRYTDKSLMKAVDPNKEWCDRYEFAMAAFCGAAAGLMDAFLIGDVSNAKSESVLKSFSDERVEKVVMAYSRMLGGKANDLSGAIAFLEKKYKVNYDQRSGKDVSGMFELSAIDHHIKSLAHAPSLVGLTFSIIDQLRDTSTMFSGGKLYVINTSGGEIHVQGKGVKEKLVAAFANWLGHCMSDVAGSKGSARNGRRGMGLAIPGTEVLMFSGVKVGKEEELLGNVMTEAFRRGYDFRVGVAQGLVLGFQKAATAVCWAFKRHYLDGRPWAECVPLEREGSLRMMQLVGNGALCMVDAGNAALKSGGEPVEFVLNFNFSAALQLAYLVLHEFDVRMGIELEKRMDALYDEVLHVSTPLERRNIQKMDERLRNYQLSLDQKYLLFCVQVEGSEAEFMQTLKATDAWYASMHKRAEASAKHARTGGVKEEKILNSVSELDVKLGVERKKGFLERFKKR